MKIEVQMPQFGETVRDGTVVTWRKDVGDRVDKGEALCEIETDKVSTDLESPVAGELVSLHVPEGETVDVGTVLCSIETEAEA